MSERYWRKIIKVAATDSPNVRLGLMERAAGLEPSNDILVPGVISFNEYEKRLATWDAIRICVSIHGEFYEGKEVKMFPPLWVNRAVTIARQLRLANIPRKARAIGCDPGEGSEDTAWAVVDELGLIELIAKPTPDTSTIPNETLALMRKYKVPAEYVGFDRGGGGKQHADRMRSQGQRVRTVAFGEPMLAPIKYSTTQVKDRLSHREEAYSYVNRRAEMYGHLRNLIDPSLTPNGFGIPSEYVELRRQLMLMPLKYDEEGRLFMLPKTRKNPDMRGKGLPTLNEIIGHSPNEADALVVAVHVLTHAPLQAKASVS